MLESRLFEFKIDYYKTKDMARGQFVSSDEISVGGHRWKVNCYPNGDLSSGSAGHVSIFLKLTDRSKNVGALFEAFIVGKDGKNHRRRVSANVFPTDARNGDRGWRNFVERSRLLPDYVVADDGGCYTIMCRIVVVPGGDDPLDVPPPDMGTHLARLVDSGDGSDVSFVVGGETFPAHRAVLAARSPVFKAELLGSMAEAAMPSIVLHDIAPATFRVMLRFIYTDALPQDKEMGDSPTEMLHDLLAMADLYALERLKIFCARKLWDGLAVDTVAATLASAEMFNCTELKKKCFAFFAEEENLKKVQLTDDFVQLRQKFPSILDELKEKKGP